MNVFQTQMLGGQSSVSSGKLTYSQGRGERCRASGLLPGLITVEAAGEQGGDGAREGGGSNHISATTSQQPHLNELCS